MAQGPQLITTSGITFTQESISEYFITPLFVQGQDFRNGFEIDTGIKSSKKLDFFNALTKITKAYAQGTSFDSSEGVVLTQKTITVEDMKAQVKQNAKEFENTAKQSLIRSGVDANNAEGTIVAEIVLKVYVAAMLGDIQRQSFFGDQVKENLTAGIPINTPDLDYNVYDGFWKRYRENSNVVAIDVNTSVYQEQVAVKQVDTVTLTGTGGTADITVNSEVFEATFNSSLTQTASDFVTLHGSVIAAKFGNIVVTSSGADVIFTAGIFGQAQLVSDAINSAGDLAGTQAATTANVQNTTLKTDASKTLMRAMYNAMPNEMKGFKRNITNAMAVGNKGPMGNDIPAYYMTSSWVENYQTTLEEDKTEAAHTKLINEQETLLFRKIPIIERPDWDQTIEEDFDNVQPHRALLMVAKNNIWGTSETADETKMEVFYDKIEQENIWRTEYKAGTQIIFDELAVKAL